MKPGEPYSSSDAPWVDRQWFDLRPERAYRLRAIHTSELQTLGQGSHIVVQKMASERARVPVTLLGIPPRLIALLEGDGAQERVLDAVLAEIFAAALSGRSIDLGRAIRAAIHRSKH